MIEIAPENSFIHAEDFSTPSELVDYLDYLDSNDTAYLELHEWVSSISEFPKTNTFREKLSRRKPLSNLTGYCAIYVKKSKHEKLLVIPKK